MKKLVLIVALPLWAMAVFGQQKKLVVTPFENQGAKLDAAVLENIQDFLINAFITTGHYHVPDRNALAQLAKEQQFQVSDWADDQKSAQIGKKLNADYIVQVIIINDHDVNLLITRILDVNTMNRLAAGDMEFTTQQNARDKMNEFVSSLIQRFDSSGGVRLASIAQPARSASRSAASVPSNFVFVQGGTFLMGSNNGDSDEKPVHTVTVKNFYMAKYEVSQKEWQDLMETTVLQQRNMTNSKWPMSGQGDNNPMYYVNWYEVIEYCNQRSIKEGLMPAYSGSASAGISCNFNANGYRLPTEAEWEYAAKGGNKDRLYYEYSGSNSVDAVAWYDGNSGRITHPVGTKAANSLGIYDMSGNVWEWCWDWYGSYGSRSQTNPVSASSGTLRVTRGGGWSFSAQSVRSTDRGVSPPLYRNSTLGFRLVRSSL